ncbi:MAG: metallophosphoesterase [Gemmatimonadaceae bacterium]
MNRRKFLLRAGAAGVLAGGGYATWKCALHHLEVVEQTLPIVGLPISLEGARLVQLSDLHVGPQVDDDYIIRAFEMANALKPDILAFTGDFVTWRGPQQLVQLERVMQAIPSARLATVAILGNHDYGFNWREFDVATDIIKLVSNHGVQVIRNDVHVVEGLNIIGVDDWWANHDDVKRARQAASATAPQLVLCHNPDVADQPAWEGYRGWMLTGHTHGGQCKPPFLPPPVLPVTNKRYSAGAVRTADGRTVYINRGVGHTLPIRVNVRPEITSYKLVRG